MRTGPSPGSGRDFADGVSRQDGAVLGHVPMVALALVELEQGASSVLDGGGNVEGGFEVQKGKLNGTPSARETEKVDGNAIKPWG